MAFDINERFVVVGSSDRGDKVFEIGTEIEESLVTFSILVGPAPFTVEQIVIEANFAVVL